VPPLAEQVEQDASTAASNFLQAFPSANISVSGQAIGTAAYSLTLTLTNSSGGFLVYHVFENMAGVDVSLVESDGASTQFLNAVQFSIGLSPGWLTSAQLNPGALPTFLGEMSLNGATFGLQV
jgi:hypothetical protein